MTDDDTPALLREAELARRTLAAPRSPKDLPTCTPDELLRWKRFLQEDARANGGTAGVLLHDGRGGLVKVTACSQVVVEDRISDPVDIAVELDRFWREID